MLKLSSASGNYQFCFSLDGGKHFRALCEHPADIMVYRGYTGAYLGLYATSNGMKTADFADIDSVEYQAQLPDLLPAF